MRSSRCNVGAGPQQYRIQICKNAVWQTAAYANRLNVCSIRHAQSVQNIRIKSTSNIRMLNMDYDT